MKRFLLLYLILSFIWGINQSYAQIGQYALKFDGIDDDVSIPGTAPLNFAGTSTFTFETWFYYTSNGTNSDIFARRGFYSQTELALTINNSNSKIIFYVGKQSFAWQTVVTSNKSIIPNVWTHVSVVKSGANVSLYLNGELDATGTLNATSLSATPSEATIYLGRGFLGYFEGSMDEVRFWNTERTADQIRQNMYKTLVGNETNLLAYYQMSNGTGTSLTDNSGNNITATLVNGTSWIASGALDGARRALEFDGIDDDVSISGASPLNFSGTSTFTFETWFYYTPNETNSDIFARRGSNSQTELALTIDNSNSKIIFYVGKQSVAWQTVATSNKSIIHNVWTHVSVVKNGANVSLYLNGELDATGTLDATSLSATPSEFPINLGNGFQGYFEGSMDELRFWNTARTESQIRENMMKSLVGNEANLITYYRFNEGAGTTLFDYTSSNRNGTLVNMDPAICWISSGAFNTWIGGESTDMASEANWSDGLLENGNNIGIFKWNLANVTTYNPTNDFEILLNNIYISSTSNILLNDDVSITGNIFGFIQTTGSGRLMQSAVQNESRTFPVTDGESNFTVTITPKSGSTSGNIGVKLNTDKEVEGSLLSPMTFWDLYGDSDLDATVVLRVDKSAIAPKILNANKILCFFDGAGYVPFKKDQVTINDLGTYYEIIIINVNKF